MEGSDTGWKPMPSGLKIIFVLMGLWALGSVMAMPVRYVEGLPFFGVFVFGVGAVLIMLALDVLGPIAFLIGLWKRKAWAPVVAFVFIGVFLLNGIVALFTVREEPGLMPILVPNLVNLIFLIVIYLHRDYFQKR